MIEELERLTKGKPKPKLVRINAGQADQLAGELAAGEWKPPLPFTAFEIGFCLLHGAVKVRGIPIQVEFRR